ncbi:unnamed protein product [Withania somnifera]
MAAKARILATILLVCVILLPWLASASLEHLRPEFLEHDSRKIDVTIHGDTNDDNDVVCASCNDMAIPSSNDETRNERSLKEKKLKKKKNKKNKKEKNIQFNPIIEGAKEGIHKFFGVLPRINAPKNTEEHVESEVNGGEQEGFDQEEEAQTEVNGGLQEGIQQEEPVQPETDGGLREGFYQQTCPQVEQIVKDVLFRAFENDSTIGAAIPRLFLHDCFVNGCDGSILLDTTPSGAPIEKLAPTNGVTVKGYELIDEIKAELEANCPGIVSCSDILAYLSRDAFVASGLPHYEVAGGRRDGMESLEANVAGNHPVPDDTVDKMIDLFKKKGLNAEDLVVLIGAHSIGVAHCFNFLYRLDIPEKAQMVDPRLSNVMRFTCTNQMNTLAFDTATQYKMDSTFYKQLLIKRGLLESDQVLAQDIRTRGLVQQFSNDEMGWFDKFGKAMTKLGAIEVLTGNQGQIRKQCRVC